MRPSYLYNGNAYAGKIPFLYLALRAKYIAMVDIV